MLDFTEFVKLYQAYEQYAATQVQPQVQQKVQPQVQPQVQQQVQPQVQQKVQQQVQPQVQPQVQQQVQPQVQPQVQQQVQPDGVVDKLDAIQNVVNQLANRPPLVNSQPKVQTIDDIILGMVK